MNGWTSAYIVSAALDDTPRLYTPSGHTTHKFESRKKEKVLPKVEVEQKKNEFDLKDVTIRDLQLEVNKLSSASFKSTKNCFNFAKGKCNRGDNCRFLHPKNKVETKPTKPKTEAKQVGNNIFDVDTPKKSLFIISNLSGERLIHGHLVANELRIPRHGIKDNELSEFIISFPQTGWKQLVKTDDKICEIKTYPGAEVWGDTLLTIQVGNLKGLSGHKSIKFRPPVDGEQVAVVAYSFEPNRDISTVSTGTAAVKDNVGTYNCSTIEGNCGALVIGGDGKCVGYHIAGSTGMNYFVPIASATRTESAQTNISKSLKVPKNS
jgi:hypothetical protein